jgi:hypothetical protein
MAARHATACTVTLLALALGAGACGGSKPSKQAAAAQAVAATQWRAGLVRWHRQMLHALNGLSLLMSTTSSLSSLNGTRTRAAVELGRFELTLSSCARTVRRLGPEPPSLELARTYALQACGSLEHGELLVEAAVGLMREGDELDLGSAAGPLSDGQNEMVVATATASKAPTS